MFVFVSVGGMEDRKRRGYEKNVGKVEKTSSGKVVVVVVSRRSEGRLDGKMGFE